MEGVTVDGHHPECRVTFGRGGPLPSLTALAGTVQSVSCLQALRTDPQTDAQTDRRPRHTIIRPDKSGV